MIKQVTWKRINVPIDGLDKFLTKYNFQPGMFHIIALDSFSATHVIVIAAEKTK